MQGHAQEYAQCSVCGSTGVDVYFGLKDQLYGTPGEWKITQCSNEDCALAWLNPRVAKESLASLYIDYYTHAGDSVGPVSRAEPTSSQGLLSGLRRISGLEKARKNAALMYLSGLDVGRVLDVGCGNGMRLRLFTELGWIAEGQDVDAAAVEYARKSTGLTVHLEEIDEMGEQQGSYDAVVMNHVLEHVPDPCLFLAECKRLLRPGGKLVAVVPNFSSTGHSFFKRSWWGLDPPRHLYHFSPNNLRKMASLAGLPCAKTFSSVSNAEIIALSSFMVRRKIPMTMPHRIGRLARVLALVWQFVSIVDNWVRPERGDECVLIWTATEIGD